VLLTCYIYKLYNPISCICFRNNVLLLCSIFDYNKLMTHLFLCPTKTICLFSSLLLIDIKSFRSIIYDLLWIKSNGSYPTYYIFLANIQLATSIHLPCYCTVHIYVVIHLCDSMRSFWVEVSLCMFLSFVYDCIAVGDLIIKKGWWWSH